MSCIRNNKIFALSLAAFLSISAVKANAQDFLRDSTAKNEVTVFIVRHAEKVQDDSVNPPLTNAGEDRAKALNRMLSQVNLNYSHTTDFMRTISTAAPLVQSKGLEESFFDQSDLPTLLKEIRSKKGNHLVVGHWNLALDILKLINSNVNYESDIINAYDSICIITIRAGGSINATLLKYGVVSE